MEVKTPAHLDSLGIGGIRPSAKILSTTEICSLTRNMLKMCETRFNQMTQYRLKRFNTGKLTPVLGMTVKQEKSVIWLFLKILKIPL